MAALGLAHGAIFRVELGRARRIGGAREREARILQLESAHRDRAFHFLGQGRSSSIMPARYIDALIASHRGDLAGAIEKAEEAARETPWLFEARLLQGHLEFENAVKLYLGGNGEKAAEEASQAQRIAASSVDSYLGRCGVAGLVIHMGQQRG